MSAVSAENLEEIDQLWSLRPPPQGSWDERADAFLRALKSGALMQAKEARSRMKSPGEERSAVTAEPLESLSPAIQTLAASLGDASHPYLPLARFRELSAQPLPQIAVDRAAALCAGLLERMAEDTVRRVERGLVLEEGAVQAERFPALVILELLGRFTPSPEPFEHLLAAIAMIRTLLDCGIEYGEYDRNGYTSLSNDYFVLSAFLLPGLESYAELARGGGLVICGGSAERRWSAARDVHCLLAKIMIENFTNSIITMQRVGRKAGQVRLSEVDRRDIAYFEDHCLFELDEAEQHELKRRMNESPPYPLIVGTQDVERFMDEGRGRLKVRLLSYLFMQGEPLDLNSIGAPVLRHFLTTPLPNP